MGIEVLILIGIILFMIAAFAFEWMPLDLVALVTLALLLVFDLVTPKEAISGFSNEAVITVMMMFILSDALVRSGLISQLGRRIIRVAGDSKWLACVGLLGLTAGLSGFINNVAAVSIFMPVAIHLAKHYGFSASQILLPLSYASIFGGTCTLIGTSTNLLVSSLAHEQGEDAFGMFEMLPLGIVLLGVGMVYTLLLMRWLPARTPTTDLTAKYHLSSFLTEIRIPDGSSLVGRTVIDERVAERFRLNVLEILRGQQRISQNLRETPLRAGDQLIVRGAMEDIVGFREQYDLLLLTDIKLQDEDLNDENNILVELQLSPTSTFEGQTLQDLDFRRRFGVFVLAINRTGETLRDKIALIPLQRWDTLLVFGPRGRVEALMEREEDFVSLEERDIRLRLSSKWWIGALVVPAVVIAAATGLMTILEASILGAVTMLVTGQLKIQQAYRAVNWTVIFLVAAILPLGKAMHNTGLAGMIGDQFARLGENSGPFVVLAVMYIVTSMLTEFVSNNSTVVLMVPIAISAAASLGVDVKPMLMAVTFAGSASFLTPMGYKTNAMVFSPGGYRFMDYIKAGWFPKILFWVLSAILIPVIWPF